VSTCVLFAGAVRALPLLVALFGPMAVLLGSLRLAMALVESWRLVVARLEARADEFYTEHRDDSSVDRLALLAECRVALEEGELTIFYEPVYSLVDDSIMSAEALVRWPHPERGLLVPDDFGTGHSSLSFLRDLPLHS